MEWKQLDKEALEALKILNKDFLYYNSSDQNDVESKVLRWLEPGYWGDSYEYIFNDKQMLFRFQYYCEIEQPTAAQGLKVEPIKIPKKPAYREKEDEEFQAELELLAGINEELKGPAEPNTNPVQEIANLKAGIISLKATIKELADTNKHLLSKQLSTEVESFLTPNHKGGDLW